MVTILTYGSVCGKASQPHPALMQIEKVTLLFTAAETEAQGDEVENLFYCQSLEANLNFIHTNSSTKGSQNVAHVLLNNE